MLPSCLTTQIKWKGEETDGVVIFPDRVVNQLTARQLHGLAAFGTRSVAPTLVLTDSTTALEDLTAKAGMMLMVDLLLLSLYSKSILVLRPAVNHLRDVLFHEGPDVYIEKPWIAPSLAVLTHGEEVERDYRTPC